MPPARLRWWLVHLIVLHSVAVGVALVFFSRFSVALGGWGEATPLFFVRQGGVFHFVVAVGYLLEFRRYGTTHLIVIAKAIAVVFLFSMAVLEPGAWSVPFSGLADGLMAVAVLLVGQLRTASSSTISSTSSSSSQV